MTAVREATDREETVPELGHQTFSPDSAACHSRDPVLSVAFHKSMSWTSSGLQAYLVLIGQPSSGSEDRHAELGFRVSLVPWDQPLPLYTRRAAALSEGHLV